MDVMGVRGGPALYGNKQQHRMYDQHDAEYIVPPHYRSDFQLYRNHNCFPPYNSRESQYFPHSHLRQNIWLDQKSHDRIQNWLSDNHEFTGYHPPEEEAVSSIRSNSAVDISTCCEHSVGDENYFGTATTKTTTGSFIPKYKSEERVQPDSSGDDNNSRHTGGVRRYNSPDCIRRRYFSPRSDPTLNIPKPGQHLSSGKQFTKPPYRNNNNDLPYLEKRTLNRAFYQSEKGNTFPRRNKYAPRNRGIPRQLLNATTTSREDMGQQMEKHQPTTYNGGVVLNPYASGIMSTDNNNTRNANDSACDTNERDKTHNKETQQDDVEKPLLVGRTFVLNGISIQSKQDNSTDAVNDNEDGSDLPQNVPNIDSSVRNNADYSNVSNVNGILNKLSSTNDRGDNSIPSNDRADDFVLSNDRIDHLTSTNEKADHSNLANHRQVAVSSSSSSFLCEERRPLPRPIARTAFHVRVVSAPATTDSNKLDRDIYWRNSETSQRRVPYQVRKVKAFSWPKRAVLPTQSADAEFVANLTRKRLNNSSSLSDSNVSRECDNDVEKNKQQLNEGENELFDRCNGLAEMDYVNISVGDLLVDDGVSENSDIPPARPPLPADHIFSPHRQPSVISDNQERSTKNTRTCSSSSSLSNVSRAQRVEEDAIVAQTHDSVFERPSNLQHDYLSDDYTSNSSLLSDHFHRKDLSKSVSMSLKDLIRIHEQEIARVSGAVSTRTLDKIDESTSTRRDSHQELLLHPHVRKSSYDSISRDVQMNTKWKRHTTLGLPVKFVTEEECDRMTEVSSTSAEGCFEKEDVVSSFEYVTELGDERLLYSPKLYEDRHNYHHRDSGLELSAKTRLSSSMSISDQQESLPPPPCALSPCTNNSSVRSPPSTLPKPKKRTASVSCSTKRTSSTSATSVTKTLDFDDEVIGLNTDLVSDELPSLPQCQRTDSTTTVESAVQTEANFERSASFRKNENRVLELMLENETIRKDFEVERDELTKKLQEQKKVANAYQKLEDRYRRKVYELQKAMKMCTCSSSNGIYPGEGDHFSYRPENSSVGDANEMSVQKVDDILQQLGAWLNHQTSGVSYPDSDISSLFGSNAEEIYQQRYSRRTAEHFNGGIDRIIDRIDATSV